MIRYLSNKRNTYHNCHCDMKLQARNQEMLLQANIQSTTRKRLGNDAFASSEYDGPLISLKSEIQNIRLSLKYIDNIHEVWNRNRQPSTLSFILRLPLAVNIISKNKLQKYQQCVVYLIFGKYLKYSISFLFYAPLN